MKELNSLKELDRLGRGLPLVFQNDNRCPLKPFHTSVFSATFLNKQYVWKQITEHAVLVKANYRVEKDCA